MTINPISLSNVASLIGTGSVAAQNNVQAGSIQNPSDTTVVSPLASFAKWLHQLQQQDPAKYQKVTGEIAKGLHKASAKAQANGNTILASELSDLSSQFETASQNGQFPGVEQLQQAFDAWRNGWRMHPMPPVSAGGSTDSSSAVTG